MDVDDSLAREQASPIGASAAVFELGRIVPEGLAKAYESSSDALTMRFRAALPPTEPAA